MKKLIVLLFAFILLVGCTNVTKPTADIELALQTEKIVGEAVRQIGLPKNGLRVM